MTVDGKLEKTIYFELVAKQEAIVRCYSPV